MSDRTVETALSGLVEALSALPQADLMPALNDVRLRLHELSPMRHHPVDLVVWVPAESVLANDYNPNAVAKPEMKLLSHSIQSDGYTQPVVTWEREDGERETVDGFHRGEVGRSDDAVRGSTGGLLPVTTLSQARSDRRDRIASTIRHNRARGVHRVDAMSDIVRELVRRNWTDKRIGKELGMEPDEVLRLKQLTGLEDLFASREFSEAWELP